MNAACLSSFREGIALAEGSCLIPVTLALRAGGGGGWWVPGGASLEERNCQMQRRLAQASTEPLNCCLCEPTRRPPALTCGESGRCPRPLRWWGGLVRPGGGDGQLWGWGLTSPLVQDGLMPGVLRGRGRTCPHGHRRPAEARSRGSAFGDPSGHPIMTSSQLCPQPPPPSSWGTGPGGAKELRGDPALLCRLWPSWLNCWAPQALSFSRTSGSTR